MVLFAAQNPPQNPTVCFCSNCRRSSGHLGQLSAPFDTEFVAWHDTGNQIKRYVMTNTKLGKPKVKLFCGNCGSTLALIPGCWDGKKTELRLTLVDEFKKDYFPVGKYMEESEADFLNGNPPVNFV